MNALFDTNILIDYLRGVIEAKKEIDKYSEKQISIVTAIEVLVGASEDEEVIIREFLSNFLLVPVGNEIAELAVGIRKKYKIKLPDAIIWASAKYKGSLLITRNTKDFSEEAGDIKVPYILKC